MADDNSVYRDLFFEESDDNLQTLNDSILELEQEPTTLTRSTASSALPIP